ncbi:hypothetical protein Tco_1531740 [Tanacetum coccineum]
MILASTSFSTSSWIALFLSDACPIFFCLIGRHPSLIFRWCSAICHGMSVMSAGLQAKHPGLEIITHSIGMTLLLRNVIVPPLIGNFNIPCAVDGMVRIFLIPGLPIIPLCWDGDLITMKFIHVEVECSSSPIFTSKDIFPSGQMVSLLNLMRCVVAGTIWLLISGWILMKQCSYRISEDTLPSTYIHCMKCPPISASMIIGPYVPSSSPKGGKEITISG